MTTYAAPQPVPAPEMSDEEWKAYWTVVWESRLSAMMRARYYRRLLSFAVTVKSVLRFLVVLGSGAAVGTALIAVPHWVLQTAAIALGACAVAPEAVDLPEKLRLLEALTDGWTARSGFWDHVYVKSQSGVYFGDLPSIRKPDFELRELETKLSFWQVKSWLLQAMDEVESVDRFAIEARRNQA